MNMKRILFFAVVVVVGLLSLTLNSCKKQTPDTETQSSVDNTVCEGEFNKSLPVINSITIKEQGVKDNRTAGPTVTIDSSHMGASGFPKTMYIDFGTTGIEDSLDHKVRKGQMVVKFYNYWHIAGATAVVQLYDFKVANSQGANFVQYSVDSIIIIHNGPGSFTHNVIGGHCVASDYTLDWSSNRTVTQTEGMTTLTPFDDVFSATGTSKGKDRNGKAYTVTIKSPIIKRATCSWMESGILDITPEGMSARTIDYGSGTCDNKASITIDGNTFTFNMN